MLRRCVLLDPAYAPAFRVLARIATGPATGELLRHVIHLQPRNPDALAEYAYWLYKNGELLNEISSELRQAARRTFKLPLIGVATYNVDESGVNSQSKATRNSHSRNLHLRQTCLVSSRQMATLAPVLLQRYGNFPVAQTVAYRRAQDPEVARTIVQGASVYHQVRAFTTFS